MEEKIRNGECTAEEASGLSGQASAPENAPSAPGGDGFAPEEAPERELPSAAKFLQASPVRFTAEYELNERQYLAFNQFIFEHTGMMKQSRLRMKYMGIGELVFAAGTLAVGLFLQNNTALFCFVAAVLAAAGVLTMLYYPYIFTRQFEKSIRQSFAASGYMGRELRVDFHDDGIVERSEEPVGALWEDVKGFYETDELALFLMEEHQAVVIPKQALGESYEEFRRFCEAAMNGAKRPRKIRP